MIGDLFDSPWKILIVALVIIVLFGSKKLPSAARSLGQSMRILKTEVSDLHHDDKAEAEKPAPALTAQPNVAPPSQPQRTKSQPHLHRNRQQRQCHRRRPNRRRQPMHRSPRRCRPRRRPPTRR